MTIRQQKNDVPHYTVNKVFILATAIDNQAASPGVVAPLATCHLTYLATLALNGVVTYTSPVEALATGIKNLDR